MEAPNPGKRNVAGNATVVDFLILTLIWLVSEVIVNPIGDFPLNDDWSFGLAVQYFIQLGVFHPTGWTSMTLFTNVIWGGIFCLPSGFSFTALRLSTLTAAWLGILGAYWLIKKTAQSRSLALLTAFILAFNPVYFELSNTFMTDVLCLTLMIFSAIFFLKNLEDDSISSLVLATMFALASILSRQVGLAVPLAFFVTVICRCGWEPRALMRAVTPLILGLILLSGFRHWLAATGRLPLLYEAGGDFMQWAARHPVKALIQCAQNIYVTLLYAGLFLLPVLLLIGFSAGSSARKKLAGLGLLLAVLTGSLILYGYSSRCFVMPLSSNNLNLWGVGPLLLHDAVYQKTNPLPQLGDFFWLIITLISLIGASLCLSRLGTILRGIFAGAQAWRREPEVINGIFLLLISILYLAPFMLYGFFDRYLITALPFLAGGLAIYKPQISLIPRKAGHFVMVFLTAGFLVFSICGTRDYLTWNRARWAALDDLMRSGRVKPSDIDGGMEFNGFYLYTPNYHAMPGKSFWWVDDDTYMVAFNPVPGYSVQRNYPFTHWLPPYTGNIYVLKKTPGASAGK